MRSSRSFRRAITQDWHLVKPVHLALTRVRLPAGAAVLDHRRLAEDGAEIAGEPQTSELARSFNAAPVVGNMQQGTQATDVPCNESDRFTVVVVRFRHSCLPANGSY